MLKLKACTEGNRGKARTGRKRNPGKAEGMQWQIQVLHEGARKQVTRHSYFSFFSLTLFLSS